MRKGKCLALFLAIGALLFLCSCANLDLKHIRPTRGGFTTELDAPSERGKLKWISSEQSDVFYSFSLSKDDKSLIYSGVQSGSGDKTLHLWKINSDGSGSPNKITSGGINDFFYPCFTSDGEYIVYESGGQLWKVKSNGSGGKLRIPGTGNGTDTSPNLSQNDKLVFTSAYGVTNSTKMQYVIWTCNLDGGDLTQIKEGSYPKWSPDGKKIVFMHDKDIWIVDADGTNLMQITNTALVFENLPSFSPDGKRIVYSSDEGIDGKPSPNLNIWTMDIDGSKKTQVTELSSWDSFPIWGKSGIYFLSGRAQRPGQYIKRIWHLKDL